MATWRLQVAGGTATSTEDLDVAVNTLTFASQVPDTLEITVLGNVDNTGWAYGDEVILTKDSVEWFRGKITRVPRFATGEREAISYIVSGPWWDLDNICYKQETGTRADGSSIDDDAVLQYTSSCVLGQSVDGSYIGTGEQIEEILDYAISVGAPLSKGSMFTGIEFPTTKVTSTTCGNAIRQLLQYHPDIVAYFSYGAGTPALHFTRQSNLVPQTIDMEGSHTVDISSREDLKPSYVEVVYEITSNVDGQAYREFSVDRVGAGPETGAINAVVNLRGDSITIQKQRLRTKTLPSPKLIWADTGEDDENTLEDIFYWTPNPDWGIEPEQEDNWEAAVDTFFKTHVRWLQEIPEGDWQVRHESFGMRLANRPADQKETPEGEIDLTFEAEEEAGTVTDLYDESPNGTKTLALPREVVGGNITPWMKEGSARVREGEILVRAEIIYTNASRAFDNDIVKAFPLLKYDPKEGGGYRMVDLQVRIRATDGLTKDYQNLDSFEQGETVPTGVAQAVYDSLNVLRYEGSITTLQEEVTKTVEMGEAVNISNGVTAWSTMDAMVQSVRHDIDGGMTTARFGPPGHLTPQTYAELLRFIRKNPVTYVSERERTEGEIASSLSTSEAGYKGDVSDTSNPTPNSPHPFQVVIDKDEDGVFTATVEPGHIWTDQANATTTTNFGVVRMVPTMGGTSLTNSAPPTQTLTNETNCYLEFDIDTSSEKVNSITVEFTNGAVPSDSDGTRRRHLAEIDLTVTPLPTVKNIIKENFYFPTGATGEYTFDWVVPTGYGGSTPALTDVELGFENGHVSHEDEEKTVKIWDLTDYQEERIEFVKEVQISSPDANGCVTIAPVIWEAYVLVRGLGGANTHIELSDDPLAQELFACPTWKTLEYTRAVDVVETGGCVEITPEKKKIDVIVKAPSDDVESVSSTGTHSASGTTVYAEPCASPPSP